MIFILERNRQVIVNFRRIFSTINHSSSKKKLLLQHMKKMKKKEAFWLFIVNSLRGERKNTKKNSLSICQGMNRDNI